MYVEFTLDKKGKVVTQQTKILTVQEINASSLAKVDENMIVNDTDLNLIIVNIINDMSKWKPAILNGKKTCQRIVLPISIKV